MKKLKKLFKLMAKITSLADEIRNKIAQDAPVAKTKKLKLPDSEIMGLLLAFDNSKNKSMVHVRFDAKTVQTLNHFKMATGVDVTKLVAFSVQELFKAHPELKDVIKQFIQNVNL